MPLLVFLLLALPAFAQPKIRIEGPFPARDGERCVVCNSALSNDDFAYNINGQRVTVMRGMEADILANPLKFIRQEPSMPASTWAGWLLLLSMMCGGACAYMAPSRGASTGLWLLLGLLFSVAAVAVLGMRPAARESSVPQ